MPTVPYLPSLDGEHLPGFVWEYLIDLMLFMAENAGVVTLAMAADEFDTDTDTIPGGMALLEELGLATPSAQHFKA